MKIAVIGAGAAGFFAALSCAEIAPEAEVFLFEKTSKLLAKVKISGGGRCNVTNALRAASEFAAFYPRGRKEMSRALRLFGSADTVNWFESRGVPLKTEPDGRMFPQTDNSQTIIDCLVRQALKSEVKIRKSTDIRQILPQNDGSFLLIDAKNEKYSADSVIIASGGSPKAEGLQWLADCGHRIESPVPSLFGFNLTENPLSEMAGLAVPNAKVKIAGTKFEESGPFLITHKGCSGPAVLKLSARAARFLAEQNYRYEIRIAWAGESTNEFIKQKISELKDKNTLIKNHNPFGLPKRLHEFLLAKAGISAEMPWSDLAGKSLNRLTEILSNDAYAVSGRTTNKDEFVTAGGVSLKEVNFETMESKKVAGMFFAGEVLDIDGLTGGFNFQAAWTSGFLAGQAAGRRER